MPPNGEGKNDRGEAKVTVFEEIDTISSILYDVTLFDCHENPIKSTK